MVFFLLMVTVNKVKEIISWLLHSPCAWGSFLFYWELGCGSTCFCWRFGGFGHNITRAAVLYCLLCFEFHSWLNQMLNDEVWNFATIYTENFDTKVWSILLKLYFLEYGKSWLLRIQPLVSFYGHWECKYL